MFVQTEITPNPNSLKFIPGKKVSLEKSIIIITHNQNLLNCDFKYVHLQSVRRLFGWVDHLLSARLMSTYTRNMENGNWKMENGKTQLPRTILLPFIQSCIIME